jgi:peroxiredoxin Q/BCP
MTIEVGAGLPDLELVKPDGRRVNLTSYAGQPLVLYFYPKDDTAGCTRQAQDFSAALPEFVAMGAQILGVSKDPPAKHAKFAAKYDLTVPLATDENDAATAAFGVWIEKLLYGRKYLGIERSTFLFGADGRLVRAWRRVKVPGHVGEVLAAVKAMH